MRIRLLAPLIVLVFISCRFYSKPAAVLQIRFSESPQPPAPDYSQTENWAALPQLKDEADITPKGIFDGQDSAIADVFFIHPTTYTSEPKDQFQWNADVRNAALNEVVDERPIKYQASVFNGSCKVYAPRYRQAHYYCFLTPHKDDKQAAINLAYDDVKSAFEYYLKNYNQGRPIIIASHSQGTIHAGRLLQEYFENKPLQDKLVAAYLIGMPVPTDSLPDMKPCDSAGETSCYISWRTFLTGYQPSWQSGDPLKLVCQNPLSWRRDTFTVEAGKNEGAVLLKFRHIYPAACSAQVHDGYLWVSKPKFPGSRFYKSANYHVADYNLFYMNIRSNVALRVAQHMAAKR